MAKDVYTTVSSDGSAAVTRYSTTEGPIVDISIPVINGLDAQIHVGLSEKYVFAQVKRLRNRIMLITLCIIVLGVLVGIVMSLRITRPIASLVDAMRTFGKGDSDGNISIKSGSREVKELAESFNLMITDRKNHEKELHKSKEEWERTFNSMDDIITIQDKDMRILRANKAAYSTFQVEPGALNGKYCYEVFRGANHPCSNCPEQITLKEKRSHSANITHENLGKIFTVTSSPILDNNGQFMHMVHIAKDVTKLKKMEEDLFQAHKMEAMGTLAGGIAHDFNNILSAIVGFSELAKLDMPDGSDAAKDIDEILNAGKRAAELVRQILSFSRKTEYHLQLLTPHLIVKEALKMLRSSLPTTLSLKQEISSDCGAIQADPTSIYQIVVNLCTNALHAMENEKGILSVSLYREDIRAEDISESDVSPGTFIVLSVNDTGHGMDNKTIDRIFEPYFTTKEVGKGTGLGLAVIHGIVKDHKGFIRVESEPGKGTTFRVYFPACEMDNETWAMTEKEPLSTGTENFDC